ncbi:MAG TPA: ABC transporter ATP-binding protein [Actinomycetota bacterium]|jgi:putative spermidine/putrescine transport system ATP-binding protein|nr:ABC transporter ATP-binding protein [Actinomycetota bacterium]
MIRGSVNERGGLRLEGLVKRFDEVTAVDGVDLELPPGKLISFLGPSGCGKTTMLRMIAGLERPTEGRIFVDDEDITDRPAYTRDIGMVFQSLALFPHLNVAGNIGYGLRIRGAPKNQVATTVEELLKLVSLSGMGERRIQQLSGGQRQRVATARALALAPRLFLLDEPLSALDANLREQLQVELRLLQQQLGITTIMVTHDQREAMTMSDLVVVMNAGRIEQVGPPLEVYRRPGSPFVAGFIGRTNLLRGEAAGDGSIAVAGRPFDIAGGADHRGEVTVSVRPEAAQLVAGAMPERNALPGTVVFVRDLGELFECFVDCGTDEHVIVAGSPRDWVPVQQGAQVAVRFPAEDCVVVTT